MDSEIASSTFRSATGLALSSLTAASSPCATRSSNVSGFGLSSLWLAALAAAGGGGTGLRKACAADADGSALGLLDGVPAAVESVAEVTAAAANAAPSATNNTSGVTKLQSG